MFHIQEAFFKILVMGKIETEVHGRLCNKRLYWIVHYAFVNSVYMDFEFLRSTISRCMRWQLNTSGGLRL